MTKKQAQLYLCQCVAEYVMNGFPLVPLTGEGINGQPDQAHLSKLQEAFLALGWNQEARRVGQLENQT